MLKKTRLCAHVLNMVCRELGIAGIAHKFTGEYSEDWIEAADGWRALVGGSPVALVVIDDFASPRQVRVEVPDVYHLIRSNHIKEFDPGSYGIVVETRRNWLGERFPDLVIDVDLREVDLPYFGGIRQDIPRNPVGRKAKARGSLHVTRRTRQADTS